MHGTREIVVVGMGYVGIPCAALLADVPGFRVTGVQRRSPRSGWKIDCLNSGRSPFEGDEPGLDELIRRVVVEKGTFRVTDDFAVCRNADTILIDVQTPVDGSRVPQYVSLREASAQIGQHLQPGTLVIIESTVAPGTTQHVVRPILEQTSGLQAGETRPDHGAGACFWLAFSYERVMPGKLLDYLVDMPRVVGGIDEESTRRAVELYRHIVKKEITATDCLTAEVAKTVENTYRDVNIAFANEMALMCESLGVNMFEVRELVNARPDRHVHVPGAGVGGHCLPKDPWLLNHGVNLYGHKPVKSELLTVARRLNDAMPDHMAELVQEALAEAGRPLAGSRIAVLGVAYLEDSDDTRNTPSLPLMRALLAGGAVVVAHDPHVRQEDWAPLWSSETSSGGAAKPPVGLTRDLAEALRGADAAVIVTRHREYVGLAQRLVGQPTDSPGQMLTRPWQQMRTAVIVDGRNLLDRAACEQRGFIYRGVGKG